MDPRLAVSWLFVPADRPDRFEKAARAGADEIILDLEDAVAPEAKPAARDHVTSWLSGGGHGFVRINGAETPWHEADLEALNRAPGLRGLIVPKAEDPERLTRVAHAVESIGGEPCPLVALVESARGIRALDAICASPAVTRVAFGSVDLALDLDAEESDEALLHARGDVVIACRSARQPAPIDGVSGEIHDEAIVAAAAGRSRALGFGGKLCIHPAQVPIVHEAFAPSPDELAWARRVLAAARSTPAGVFTVDGRMIDRPLLVRAQRLVARARPSESWT